MKIRPASIPLTAAGRRLSLTAAMAAITGGCAGCDQATKALAAYALPASGPLSALGNMIDRIRFGFIRDFATIGFGPVRTGIFNFADGVLFLGVAPLIAGILRDQSRTDGHRKSHGPPS